MKTNVLNVSSEARTKEILWKPIEEQNERLTLGLSLGPRALFVLAADQGTEAYLCLQTLFMQSMSGKMRPRRPRDVSENPGF